MDDVMADPEGEVDGPGLMIEVLSRPRNLSLVFDGEAPLDELYLNTGL